MNEKPTHEELEQRIRDLEEEMVKGKQAEEALRESETRYRGLFENMLNGFAYCQILYKDGRPDDLIYLDVNKAFGELTGLQDVVGQRFTEVIPGIKEATPELFDIYARVAETGSPERFEIDFTPVDTWLNISVYSPQKGYVVSVFDNITDRKQAAEALRESEEKYRTILDEIDEGYFEVDLTGKFTFVSDWFLNIAGSSRDELLTMNNRDYMTPESAKKVYNIFTELVQTGEPVKNVGHEIITPEGEHRHHELSASLIRDREGNPIGFRGTTRDVSERIKAEEEKAKLEAQLQQAQRMEALGTLAGGIAHNFNNVLMGIQGRASLMMMDKDGSHRDFEHLKGIKEYVKNATELTKDLLGFARGGKYEPRPIGLNELIKHENLMFGRTRKEITLQGKYNKDLWTVEVDQGQMRQVLMNLYVNAWQAMPGGGDIYVQTENVTVDEGYVKPYVVIPGRYVKISVTDTGVGMDEATREKIFDPFFTTQEMGTGTGLGLASVYGIVKNHGGFINVYSEKGEGTTFNIYLPVSEKEVLEEKKPTGEVVKGEGTILFVDDEEMITDVGELLLEKLGYHVLTAKSGQEALDVYGKNMDDIDLVILDMIMPGMGGGETYDRLKEIKPDIKVLLSSGYSINGQAQEIMDRGCNAFIQKPFSLKEISQIIREHLDKG
jgi:PAS domain S-box-containing protein